MCTLKLGFFKKTSATLVTKNLKKKKHSFDVAEKRCGDVFLI